MRKRVVWDCLGIFAVIILIVFLTRVYADLPDPTIYVSPTGTDGPACGSPGSPCKTIAYALNRDSGPAVLNIQAGNYNESLNITKNATIIGAAAATTIIAGSGATPPPPTIQILGAKVEISGLTIKGGEPGLVAVRALLNMQKCIFMGSTAAGLKATMNSGVFAQSCTFKSNNGAGVSIDLGSSALLQSCTASLNKEDGVSVSRSSSAELVGNFINSNTKRGVNVNLTSNARLQNNTISGNKVFGLMVHRQSAAELQGGNKITTNGQHQQNGIAGIGIFYAGHAFFKTGSKQDNIATNKGDGIALGYNSDLYMESNSATITGNEGYGVSLSQDSGAYFENGVAITNNQLSGIRGWDGSHDSKYNGNPTVTGNGAPNIDCPIYTGIP